MFLAIVFIILGLFLLLNAMGIIVSANFWGFFWAILFLAIGIRLLVKRGRCPMCGWGKMHKHCNCEGHGHTGHDEE
ncbi:MAG: DUF5668 domain-containing protein [Candidatus Staskawiczbacteria bacterium]|jgi:hypothetical protein